MNRNYRYSGDLQEKGSNADAAAASIIDSQFHNPYTFIPFPDCVERFPPTPLTADELPDETWRHSGVIELEIRTLSPLLSCSPIPYNIEETGHGYYKALRIGNDIVVPATGIRGALRTLMTIISGGTLGYMDEELWLTQGRDAQLGPSTKLLGVPKKVFLAEVITSGNSTQPGILHLGETRLIKTEILEKVIRGLDSERPSTGKNPLYIDDPQNPTSSSKTYSERYSWKVKLSGKPVNRKNKKEGLFKAADGRTIPLSEHFWKDYQGRNRHSDRPELRTGDLVWLEPADIELEEITEEKDIASIQWTRWGRHGIALKNILPRAVVPDSMRKDGAVDMVTDLFGQVPHPNAKGAAGPFAARIRPGNLVFRDAAGQVTLETLAPLAAPHPGCVAFYRDQEDLDLISTNSRLKGYKVYRNTHERGENAPWKYSVQGVYAERGVLKHPDKQKVNKTAELLNEGSKGVVRISFRSLGDDELALFFAACSIDWKLGGGKPLGLGHCRVAALRMIDEDGGITEPMGRSENGENLTIPPDYFGLIEHYAKRIELYRASQIPVLFLRYPRAVTKNNNKSNRSGLSWFSRHASLRKSGKGLGTIWTQGPLKERANATQIKAQSLPELDAKDQDADLLYGYDVVALDIDTTDRNQTLVGRMEPFDPEKHAAENEKAGENLSSNSDSRRKNRDERQKRN